MLLDVAYLSYTEKKTKWSVKIFRKTNYCQFFSPEIPSVFFFLFLESILFMGRVTNPDTQKVKGRDLDSLWLKRTASEHKMIPEK